MRHPAIARLSPERFSNGSGDVGQSPPPTPGETHTCHPPRLLVQASERLSFRAGSRNRINSIRRLLRIARPARKEAREIASHIWKLFVRNFSQLGEQNNPHVGVEIFEMSKCRLPGICSLYPARQLLTDGDELNMSAVCKICNCYSSLRYCSKPRLLWIL